MEADSKLHIADYVLFCIGLAVSLATGIYYAVAERKKSSTYGFHRGGGKLKALPVALSMLVTFESSIFYLGYPAEVYIHGIIFWLVNFGTMIGLSSLFWISIPLFYPLQVTSVFEYLQLRHDSQLIRQVAMVLNTIFMVLYAALVLFGAALALQSVMGLSVWIYIVVLSVIAMIYTSLGGIKAVIATDVVQGIIMIVIILAVLIYGTVKIGGVTRVLDYNRPSGRLQLVDFDTSPFTRHTFWTLIIGAAIRSFGFSCRQMAIQRLNSTKSVSEARKVAAISIPGFFLLESLVMLQGLVAFAYFTDKGCDPLASGQISNPNQIMSFAVMDMFTKAPGVTGLFLAAICSATLSTLSSLLSSVSALISEDVLKVRWRNASDVQLTKASKLAVLVCGVVCTGFGVVISETKGPITQISGSILGAMDGPMTALFFMSIFLKFTTRKGILVSILCGVLFAMWLSLGYNFSTGRKETPWLPLGPTDKCENSSLAIHNVTYSVNITFKIAMEDLATGNTTESLSEITGLNYLYSISYMYFAAMVTFVSLAVGISISLMTKVERQLPIPRHLMLIINKQFFKCKPNLTDDSVSFERQKQHF
ncbi:Sodium-coupled monocarboxylate transporter 1 [Mactra antiquata]